MFYICYHYIMMRSVWLVAAWSHAPSPRPSEHWDYWWLSSFKCLSVLTCKSRKALPRTDVPKRELGLPSEWNLETLCYYRKQKLESGCNTKKCYVWLHFWYIWMYLISAPHSSLLICVHTLTCQQWTSPVSGRVPQGWK
jgi:hypothetical protein